MRVPLIIALAVLALVLLALLWIEPEAPSSAATDTKETAAATRHLMQSYRVGHDWIEAPIEIDSRHPLLKGDWQTETEFQCTQPECRTCQWMRTFGGEW